MRRRLEKLTEKEYPDHVGLAYDTWAPVDEFTGKIPDDKRASWLNDLAGTVVSPDYKHSFERWKNSLQTGDRYAEVTFQGRLLVGHGNASATDVGLSVHHTWGVPVIPGAALKGLAAHYMDAVYGPEDHRPAPWEQRSEEVVRAGYQGVTWSGRRLQRGPGEVYRALFGAPDAAEDGLMRERGYEAGASRGLVTFHDALFIPSAKGLDKPFAPDVLTVHQPGYYQSAGGTAANDYDSPNPVAFLSVRPQVRLLVALSGPEDWTEIAAQLLKDALEQWGVGSKTAAGYGVGKIERWQQVKPKASETLAQFEAWYQAFALAADGTGPGQRDFLRAIDTDWLGPLLATSAADREQAASVLGKRLNSKKLKEDVDRLRRQLREGQRS